VTLKEGPPKEISESNGKDSDENKLPLPLKILRTVLTGCFFVTVGHKWNGNKVNELNSISLN
jgi:hypothetical protein